MPVIRVLCLPRDERLRAAVSTAIDFVEEVYRDEILSDLRLMSFDMFDPVDLELAKAIAVAEGFDYEVVHRRCRHKWTPSFFHPHYNPVQKYVWAPVSALEKTSYIFYVLVHEVIHHVFYKLPEGDRSAVITALRSDLGADVDEIVRRYGVSLKWVKEVRGIVDEVVTLYVADNYFVKLEREPRTPTHHTDIKKYAEGKLVNLVFRPPRTRDFFEELSTVYLKLAHQDLANFRRAMHEAFVKTIKRFPVDILESNRAKYGILYRSE
jgi:hypothetical protein